MTSTEQLTRARVARRRRGSNRAEGERRVGRAIGARQGLAPRRVGRAWINGREVGGADPRYLHLSESHD